MGVNSIPRFVEQPQTWKTKVSTANTNIGGNTGTLVTLVTGATPHGSKLDYLWFQAQGATTVNRLRLYLFSAGGTPHLLRELEMTAESAAAADKTLWTQSFTPATPIIVPSGWSVQASIHVANVVSIFGFGGDY